MKKQTIVSKPKPFVKWLGGKSRMVQHIFPHTPKSCDTYYEPFLGGGAMLVQMAISKKFNKAVACDLNYDVINAWNVVKNDVDELIKTLKDKQYLYNKESYLRIRSLDPVNMNSVERASRFIYLNKTCFNGIWRVNKKGQFNVPFGKYTDPLICDSENLIAVSNLITDVEFIVSDFEELTINARKEDFVYFDPPYAPISDTSKFSSYTSDGFSEEDHIRLSNLFHKLCDREVVCIMSNSSASLVGEAYSKHQIIELMGSRSVAGPGDWRKSVKELLIVGKIDKAEEEVVTL